MNLEPASDKFGWTPGRPQVNKELQNIVPWTTKIRPVGRSVVMITNQQKAAGYSTGGDWQATSGVIGQWDPDLAELLFIAIGNTNIRPVLSSKWPNVNAFNREVGALLFIDDVSVVGQFLGIISNSGSMNRVYDLLGYVK
jgi:hypothetical protein